MEAKVAKDNPGYSDEQVKKTVGNIWYNELSQYRRDKLTNKHEGTTCVTGQEKTAEYIRTVYEGPGGMTGETVLQQLYKVSPPAQDNFALQHNTLYEDDPEEQREVAQFDYIVVVGTQEHIRGRIDSLTLGFGSDESGERSNMTVFEYGGHDIVDALEHQGYTVLNPPDKTSPVEQEEPGETITTTDPGYEFEYTSKEGAMRIKGERVTGERVFLIDAAQFPNLFSSDTRKWIELQTRNLAANMGPISSPEQAVAFVNDAAKQVMSQISEAVSEEVTKIIDSEKDNILKEIVTEDTTFEEDLMAPPPGPQMPMEMAPPADMPIEESIDAPIAASEKALMPHKLRVAFEKAANPAEQSLSLVKLDPTFLAHLEELEEQAESVERLAEYIKDYIIGRGLIDQGVADTSDWLEPTKLLTSG